MRCGYVATWLLGSAYVGEHQEHWTAVARERYALAVMLNLHDKAMRRRSPDL